MKKIVFYIIAFIFFISTSFADNIVLNYANNGIKYFSNNHPKSYNLNIEIKYPNNWVAQEGLRPHIVQKFISEEGKSNCVLLIQKLPQSLSYNDWLETTKDINGIKEVLFAEINADEMKITPTHYSGIPGDLIELTSKVSQAGFTVYMSSVQHILFYEDKMIALQCYTGGETKQISQKNMNILYPLFRAMGNDIILHNKYTELQKNEPSIQKISQDADFFIIDFLMSFIFTWGLGLLIPLIIRFKYKKRVSKKIALLVVLMIWLFQFVIAEILTEGQGNHRHTALFFVAVAGYNIIVKKKNKK